MTVDTPPRPRRPAGHRRRPRPPRRPSRRGVAVLAGVLVTATTVGVVLGTRSTGVRPFTSACAVAASASSTGVSGRSSTGASGRSSTGASGRSSTGASGRPSTGAHPWALSPEQAQDAAVIAAVAHRRRLPDHAVTVALATSLQESGLLDLPYGDRDSVGLFQQRPSQGWGTRSELLDPVFAAGAFYDGLLTVPGWETLPVTEAAQAVQRSAAPSAYAAWESEARALAIGLTGEAPGVFSCHLDGFAGAAPAPSALDAAARSELGASLIGTTVATKTGWQVAAWAVAHAWQYHLGEVTFEGWRWTAASGRWAPGSGPVSSGVVRVVQAR